MALSKLWTVGDFNSRVANRCAHVEKFDLDEENLLRIAKMAILENFSAGNSSLRKFYESYEDLSVTGNNKISIAGKNYFDVIGIVAGKSQLYHRARSLTEFTNVQNGLLGKEMTEKGRYWLMQQGKDEILIFQGSTVISDGSDDTLTVHHIRYPDLSNMTQEAAEANIQYMDVPDFMIPFFYLSTVVGAIKEQNIALPTDVSNEMTGVIAQLSDKLSKEEVQLANAHLDRAGT